MRTLGIAIAALLVLGCGDSSTNPDAGPGADAAAARDAGPRPDGAPPAMDAGPPDGDAGPPNGDAGPGGACEPTPGPGTGDAYCDLFHLALFDVDGATPRARLWGRLRPNAIGDDGCAAVDSVEVQEGGVTIGTLTGVGAYDYGDQNALLASGDVLPEMRARCADETRRFNGFGFIVRGRHDGGTFEARCADAEGGSRWPPALYTTCHENVDAPPGFGAYAMVMPFGPGQVATSFDFSLPHGPGGEITAVDGTVRVVSHTWGFGGGVAPPPFDITGLTGTVSEGSSPWRGDYTQVNLFGMGDPLGEELCPTPDPGLPGPDTDPPPVMIVRFTGTARGAPMRSEAYVDMCQRSPAFMP